MYALSLWEKIALFHTILRCQGILATFYRERKRKSIRLFIFWFWSVKLKTFFCIPQFWLEGMSAVIDCRRTVFRIRSSIVIQNFTRIFILQPLYDAISDHLPPLSKDGEVSSPTFLQFSTWAHKYQRPLTRGLKFGGCTAIGQATPIWKGVLLSKIHPFNFYPYFIISWINIGIGNIEGPWLGAWNVEGI
jgi:hypothetical protein